MFSLDPIFLSLKLASITTVILLIITIPLSLWLSSVSVRRSMLKLFVETFVSMPLVLPPSVLGFYLLIAFNTNSVVGGFLNNVFGIKLVFSFYGILLASIIFSLPFMMQPILSGFRNLPANLKEASYTLGKGKVQTLMKVLLPNIKTSVFSGCILAFAHTIGEFGAVLMIGGNIAETRTASIAIYNEVEALNYTSAHYYSLILLTVSFIILLTLTLINKNSLITNKK